MRINKYLASCNLGSRRKCEELILEGKIKVNNKVVTNLSTQIEEKDVVTFDETVIKVNENMIYLIFNKPKGCVTTVSDDKGRKTVMDYIKGIDERVYPVGRLDYDSEGLLLLTNDGDLTQKLTHPKHEIDKTYSVKIEGMMLESELAVIRAGVVIDGEKFGKAKVKVVNYDGKISTLEIVIHEGKNREIRRIMEYIGKTVTYLKRIKIGELKVGGLGRGEFRKLKDYEIEYLKSL